MLGDRLEDKIKFYGDPACLNTAKCLYMAAEKGVDIESHYIDADGQGDAAEALVLSPDGSFPVIRDGDLAVYGINAIMSFLDDKGFGPSLVPRKSLNRTTMYQWIHIATDLAQQSVADLEAGKGDKAIVAHWFDALEGQLNSKDASMRGDYICGEFSMADVHWAALAQGCFLADAGDVIESRTAVNNWWTLMIAHPSTSKEDIKGYDVLPTMGDIQSHHLRDIQINA